LFESNLKRKSEDKEISENLKRKSEDEEK